MSVEYRGTSALITGGSGFIGYHLGKRLESLGWRIILVDKLLPNENDHEFHQFIRKSSVEFLQADLTNQSEVYTLPLTEYVFHFAALNGTQNFYTRPYEVLVDSGIPIIFLLNHFGGRAKFVYAGSSESYAPAIKHGITIIPTPETAPFIIDEPANPRWSYSMGKSFGEIACQAFSTQKLFNSLIIRFHNVYGPRMGVNHVVPDLILNALDGTFILKGWENTRSFIYIDDAVNDIVQLVTRSVFDQTCVYNLGGEDEISILNLGTELLKLMKIRGEFHLEDAPAGSTMRRKPDLTLINNILGRRKRVTLETGLRSTIDWYKANREIYTN